ncbi:hypothetical protein [Spirosoma radiotolerans]|uniref:Uncharacterized protein n=1 Tax=Spirosoma radiotolerans TaxID=1379870 RepID=A0A0E3V714_9BACT|nr:hypothetical protein [Spirosoma radiotolerans]AKD55031.1 hypothetical protein SD10_09065 [Spirosoma radiotolerans]
MEEPPNRIQDLINEISSRLNESNIFIREEFIRSVILELRSAISVRNKFKRLYSLSDPVDTMNGYLTKYREDYESQKITEDELEWVVNYWLDNYPIKSKDDNQNNADSNNFAQP